MRRTRSISTLIVGVWALGWFALYLEIARYHHVSLSHLDRVLWPSTAGVQPGAFVRAVVVSSILAPVCAALLWIGAARSRVSLPRVAFAPLGLGVGALIAALGAVNQLVRRSPFGVDLTLRTGNVGFIIIGVALVAAALIPIVRDRLHSPATREQ